MAGKSLTQTDSKALASAIDNLTKNQMADVLLDLARLQIGNESASDDELIRVLQGWIDPILAVRGDTPLSLTAKYQRYTDASAKYLAQLTKGQS